MKNNRLLNVFIAVSFAFSASAYAADAGRFKTNQPIEINSDSLEVLQEESRAIFVGNVVAVQGDVRLKSDKMTVHYTQSKDKAATAPKDKGAAEGKSSIERIEVEGNVFLTTPEETASGATGLYEVTDKIIHLNDKVVLTRGKNVLKGDHLVYNMNTGKSVISSGSTATAAGAGKKERVRALFIPGEEKK